MQPTPFRIRRRFSGCLLAAAALLIQAIAYLPAQSSDSLKINIPPPPTGVQTGAGLGAAVAVDGAYAVAAASQDDTGGTDSGVVKVFDSTTGALLHVITHPNPADSQGWFGNSVAISGTTLVVASHYDYVDTVPSAGRVYVYNLAGATPTVPVATLENPDPYAGDFFGTAVSVSGSRVVVGTPGNKVTGTICGSVYVYNLAGATPTTPVQILDNPDPNETAGFGSAVGISGLRIIVGAPDADTGASNSGSAYAYNLGGATPTVPVATFHNPTPASGDSFGQSVGISGTRILIGAPEDDAGATSAGIAYVYDLSSPSPTVPVVTLSKAGPAAYDRFGIAVALVGPYALVSAYTDTAGASVSGEAYLFDVSSATPTVPAGVFSNPAPAAGDYFGIAVGMTGSSLIIGASGDDAGATDAGSAYVYDLAGATPTTPVATLNHPGPGPADFFGQRVAVSGSIMAVSYGNHTPGTPYVQVFDLSGAAPATPVLSLNVGSTSAAVAVSGTRVVVGSRYTDVGGSIYGVAYVYDLSGPTPATPVATLSNPGTAGTNIGFGVSVAISGTKVAVGSEGGEAYVFDLSSPTPSVPVVTFQSPTPATEGSFGSPVAISGNSVVVGDPYENTGATAAGAVHVFNLAAASPAVAVATFVNPAPASQDRFGRSLAISGTTVAVGCSFSNLGGLDSGMAYVYELTGPTPESPALIVPNPTPAAGDLFGSALDISGTYLVVGSSSDDDAAANSGRAYVFNLSRAAPAVPVQVLSTPPLPRANDYFGSAVAIDGLRVVVGAPGVDTVMFEKGYAYVYGPATTLTQTPSLAAPSTGAIHTGAVNVSFSLPENALPGSVKLSFQKGAECNVFTLAASQESSGAHSFTFNPVNPSASPEIASASPLADGVYTIALSYQDTIGSGAATSNAATNVMVDLTSPTIAPPAGEFSPLIFPNPVAAPDYTPQAVVSDAVGVTSVTQTPAPGTMLPLGSTLVTLTAADAAGHTASTSFNVLVVTFAQDSDGDGLNDGSEVQMAALGFNWQVAQPDLVNTLFTNANGAGLYTTSQIQAVNVNAPLLERNPTTGLFKLTLGLQKSPDLENFTPFPMTELQTFINSQGELEFYFASPGNAAFFRVQAD